MAFEFGQKIREQIEEGMATGRESADAFANSLMPGGTEEAVRSRVEALKKKIAENASEIGYELERYSGGTPRATKLEKETKELEKQLDIQGKAAAKFDHDRQKKEFQKSNAEALKKQNEENAKAESDLFRRLDEGAESTERFRRQAQEEGDRADDAAYRESQEQSARMYEEWRASNDAMKALTRAVEQATEVMRDQQNSAVLGQLQNISVILTDLRSITALRPPRR